MDYLPANLIKPTKTDNNHDKIRNLTEPRSPGLEWLDLHWRLDMIVICLAVYCNLFYVYIGIRLIRCDWLNHY